MKASQIHAADIPWGQQPAERGQQFQDSWRLMDDAELMLTPDPQFIVDGVIPDRGVCALVSPPGIGKTTLLADLMFSVATGTPWFGHRVLMPGPCIYVAAEDPGGFKLRVRARKLAAGLSLDRPVGIYTFPEPIDMRDSEQVARFSTFLSQAFDNGDTPRRILAVDTYAAATPGANENSSEDTTLVMSHSQRWRDELGLTVFFAHHTNASGTRERGHSAMRGACDCMISMTQNDDVVIVENTKQRNAGVFEPIILKLLPMPSGQGMVFRLAADIIPGEALSVNQAKLLEVLRNTFEAEGATKSEWQRTCPDVPERTFHRVCTVLVERGLVVKEGPRYRLAGPGRGAK